MYSPGCNTFPSPCSGTQPFKVARWDIQTPENDQLSMEFKSSYDHSITPWGLTNDKSKVVKQNMESDEDQERISEVFLARESSSSTLSSLHHRIEQSTRQIPPSPISRCVDNIIMERQRDHAPIVRGCVSSQIVQADDEIETDQCHHYSFEKSKKANQSQVVKYSSIGIETELSFSTRSMEAQQCPSCGSDRIASSSTALETRQATRQLQIARDPCKSTKPRHKTGGKTTSRPFQCHICDKSYKQRSGLFKHYKVHSNMTKVFMCQTCGFTAPIPDRFSCRAVNNALILCDSCGLFFDNPRVLDDHISNVQKTQSPRHSKPKSTPRQPDINDGAVVLLNPFKRKRGRPRKYPVVHSDKASVEGCVRMKSNTCEDVPLDLTNMETTSNNMSLSDKDGTGIDTNNGAVNTKDIVRNTGQFGGTIEGTKGSISADVRCATDQGVFHKEVKISEEIEGVVIDENRLVFNVEGVKIIFNNDAEESCIGTLDNQHAAGTKVLRATPSDLFIKSPTVTSRSTQTDTASCDSLSNNNAEDDVLFVKANIGNGIVADQSTARGFGKRSVEVQKATKTNELAMIEGKLNREVINGNANLQGLVGSGCLPSMSAKDKAQATTGEDFNFPYSRNIRGGNQKSLLERAKDRCLIS